jgi:uncharacterized metal-binding protein YceD (DUF177 family)
MSKPSELPWSVPVARHQIPEAGAHYDLSADEKTRERIAALAGVRSISRLDASFDVRPHGLEGLWVSGRVCARVGQTCVVSLEPMETDVDEEVDLTFMPKKLQKELDAAAEVHIEGDDAPEALINETVDLGAIAAEFAVLGIDPYPRKPGVAFEPPAATEDPASHPFAALAALKASGKADS